MRFQDQATAGRRIFDSALNASLGGFGGGGDGTKKTKESGDDITSRQRLGTHGGCQGGIILIANSFIGEGIAW